MPIALITGASSGIGLHTAVQLAATGHTVVATLRDPGRANQLRELAGLAEVSLDIRALDVTDDAACRALVAAVITDHGSIDILVNNAGRGHVGTAEQLSLDDLRAQLELNYVSVARMTQLVLPGMRVAKTGRIVTITSVGGVVGQPFNESYCAAKFAAEGFMESLAPVAKKFGVLVSIVEPGPVATEFVANVGRPDIAPDDPYGSLLGAYIERSRGAFANAQDAADVARVVVDVCTTSEPKFRYQTSAGSSAFVGVKLGDLDGAAVQAMTSSWLG